MALSGDASKAPSDRPEPAATPAYKWQLQSDFDIDVFLGAQEHTTEDEHFDRPRWLHKLSGPGVRRSLGDIVFSLTVSLLKKAITAALIVFMALFMVYGTDAPWGQLKRNILRGGADEASIAQCTEVGEWFSLFDKHTARIYRLLDDAGPPDTWDTITLTKVSELLPMYMEDWLGEMQRNPPPPAGRQLNMLFTSFLENYGGYVLATQEGDLKAQKYFERENSIILAGLDIEIRHITNLCI